MSDPDFDARKLPNFDAFRRAITDSSPGVVNSWIDKMEGWAAAAKGEIEKLDAETERYERQAQEQIDAEEALEVLQERVLDLDRGIIDPAELVLEVQRAA